jgi:hypothetical protein
MAASGVPARCLLEEPALLLLKRTQLATFRGGADVTGIEGTGHDRVRAHNTANPQDCNTHRKAKDIAEKRHLVNDGRQHQHTHDEAPMSPKQ